MPGWRRLFTKRQKAEPSCAAVIVAAGSARRMEGIDKILTPLSGVPVLARTLAVFQDCPLVREIVVVTREDLLGPVGDLRQTYGLDKVTKVIVGGKERMDSVQAGLGEVDASADLIAIHDGARPLVTPEILAETIHRAAETGAAAPGIPVVDTLKRVEGGCALETVDRDSLRAIQTPQIFEAGLIRGALQKAREDKALLTDDCAAVERLGMKVSVTAGSRENLKITTPFDLLLGTAILAARAAQGEEGDTK